MIARRQIRLFAAWLLATVVASSAIAQDKAAEFARVDMSDDGQPRALQMSIHTYADANRLIEVDLVGAVHIGDPIYYHELNERFREYDAVLFELIAPEDALGPNRMDERGGILSTTQVGMMKMLDLSFQLDEIKYDAANFVHADLSPKELRASMDERGESLYVYFWRIFFASLNDYAKDPLGLQDMEILSGAITSGNDNSLKVLAAFEVANLKAAENMLGDDSENAIIGARNQRAIDVLERELESGARRIAIFYGVAHMPDLESRLIEQVGLALDRTDWVDAWQLGDGERGVPRKNIDNL